MSTWIRKKCQYINKNFKFTVFLFIYDYLYLQ